MPTSTFDVHTSIMSTEDFETLKKDAARYRWIIARMHRDHNGIDGPSRWFFAIYDRDEGYPKSSPYYKGEPFANVTAAIDAAIDAAIERAAGGEG